MPLGENDVGKTSFLYALEKFFVGKKLTDASDWFKDGENDSNHNNIEITLTFQEISEDESLKSLKHSDGSIKICKVFEYGKAPETSAILEDESEVKVSSAILKQWFSSDNFHFIPVRRDLAVQFSMAKTALLGKTIRAKMKQTLDEGIGSESLAKLEEKLTNSIEEPRQELQKNLQEQMHNESLALGFDELERGCEQFTGAMNLVANRSLGDIKDDNAKLFRKQIAHDVQPIIYQEILALASSFLHYGLYEQALIQACSACEIFLTHSLEEKLLERPMSNTQIKKALDDITFSQLLNLHLFTICDDIQLETCKKNLGNANWARKRRNEIVHSGKSEEPLNKTKVEKGIDAIKEIISCLITNAPGAKA